MTTWHDSPDATPPHQTASLDGGPGEDHGGGDDLPSEPAVAGRAPAQDPPSASTPWGDPTLRLDGVDPSASPWADLPARDAQPGLSVAFPLSPPPGPPLQPMGASSGVDTSRYGTAASARYGPVAAPLGGRGSPAGQGPPPPPEYPPLHRFPSGGAAPAASSGSSSRRRRPVVPVLVAALLAVALAGAGFLGGRELIARQGDAATAAPAVSASASAGGEGTSSGKGAAASVPGQVLEDQAGPVTQAPKLDPDLRDDPAAAVHDAVSPAVVQIDTAAGLGTGFVYDAAGYILTAAHVVSLSGGAGAVSANFADTVTVRLADGTRVRGKVLGADLNNDVAVVKIDPIPGLPVAALALGETARVGSIAIAIGSPFGLDQTVTQGIVSAVDRPVASPNNNIVSMIQTDAAINSGNSGGPLVDRRGRVIGINTQIRTDSGDNAGIGFAVPIELAYDVAQSLIRGEPIRLGYLGVRTSNPAFGSSGAMVMSVEPGSPAATAGINEGDLIVSVNGRAIRGFEELASIIRATAPGEVLKLRVERDGKELELSATVGGTADR